jgi:hypothetical protein
MKVSKIISGEYKVTLHGFEFLLENTNPNWALYNKNGVELNQSETKSGMLQIMKDWSADRVAEISK